VLKYLKLFESFSNFDKWFGDSKIVDKSSKPLMVYHGSPDLRNIEEDGVFQTPTQRFNDIVGDDSGVFFFTKDYICANSYADETRAFDYQNCRGGVISVYLKMENPYYYDNNNESWKGTRKLVDKVKEMKRYDGVVITNTKDNYNNTNKTKSTTVYIVFHPNQIKSVKNNGEYDINKNNIFESSFDFDIDDYKYNFYKLFNKLVYIKKVEEFGVEYKIYMIDINGLISEYVGSPSDIKSDFIESDEKFKMISKKRVIRNDDRNTFSIVYYNGNRKISTVKNGLNKKLAYSLKAILSKDVKYKMGVLRVENN